MIIASGPKAHSAPATWSDAKSSAKSAPKSEAPPVGQNETAVPRNKARKRFTVQSLLIVCGAATALWLGFLGWICGHLIGAR
jgi:hypothetical protein